MTGEGGGMGRLFDKARPTIAQRPTLDFMFGGKPRLGKVQVIDFSGDTRPAYRVAGHCRNCRHESEARFPVGRVVPLYVLCTACETYEFSAHDGFLGRDFVGDDELTAQYKAEIASGFHS